MNDLQNRERSIFLSTVVLGSAAEQAEYLDKACDDNDELRQNVEALLDAHRQSGDLFDRSAVVSTKDTLSALPLGGQLGEFTLIREIGHGGMGVVYEARQASLDRKVAVKVLPFAAVLDQRQLKRFETEAKAAAGLHHGNIVPIFHVGSDRAVHFYAMQFIEGQDVAELIVQLRQIAQLDGETPPQSQPGEMGLASSVASGHFAPAVKTQLQTAAAPADESPEPSARPPSQSVMDTQPFAALATKDATNRPEYFRTITHLGIQAATALDFAHERGILHRDIKPSNLMLDTDGRLWITDFGLARVEGDAGLTMTGDVLGTLRYMSPELILAKHDSVDHRSDIYSLGATLYELLTLQPTWPGSDRNELLQQRAHQEPVPPRQINRAIPLDLETVVLKAMAREPGDRYATAEELAADLQRYLNGEPIHARPPSVVTRLSKWSTRNRGLAALLIAAAFIGGIVAASVVVVIRDRDGNVVAKVTAPSGSNVEVNIDGTDGSPRGFAAIQDESADQLPGLIPHPETLPGVGRWQVVARRPRTFLPHNWKFSWSPDSRFLAFGDGDDVRVYSVPDFQLVRLYSGHTGSVVAVDWSPDGKTIASTSIDNTVRLWDAETGVPGPILVGHRDRVNAVSWHPDGQMLATGGRDNTVRVWSADGTLQRVIKGHTGIVADVAWSPDGKRLATVEDGGSLRLWSANGELQKVIPLRYTQRTVAWSPDGQRLLVAQLSHIDSVKIWNSDGSGELILKDTGDNTGSATWSPDGTQIAVASWDDHVHLFDSDGAAGPILEGHDGNVHFVEWSPDGIWLASGGGDRSIRLWTTDRTPGPVLKGLRVVSKIAWNPDGQKFGACLGDRTGRVCDANGAVERIFTGHTGPVSRIDWSPNGKQIVSLSEDRSIQLWNVSEDTARLAFAEKTEDGNALVSWNPNGRLIASADRGRWPLCRIRFWDPDGTARAVFNAHKSTIYGLAWNAVGDRLASVSMDQSLRLWTTEGKTAGEFNSGHFLTSVAWNPDGTQLITGCDDGTIQIWTSGGKPIQVLKGHDNRATDVKWSGDGKRIASASRDSTIRLWSEDGSSQAILTGHTGDVESVDWRPHSRQLLSAGHDATIRLWDTETRRVLWILVVLPDKQTIKFSPEGRILDGDPAVFEREFRYIVEQPSGAMEIITPKEFQTRTQQRVITQNK